MSWHEIKIRFWSFRSIDLKLFFIFSNADFSKRKIVQSMSLVVALLLRQIQRVQ